MVKYQNSLLKKINDLTEKIYDLIYLFELRILWYKLLAYSGLLPNSIYKLWMDFFNIIIFFCI